MSTSDIHRLAAEFKDVEPEYERYYIKADKTIVKVTGPSSNVNDGVEDVCAKILVNVETGKKLFYVKMAGSNLYNPREKYRNTKIQFVLCDESKFKAYCLFLDTRKDFLLSKAERT